MAKNLVIVESPAKAKTISRFLGKNYKVLASMGHIRDLPKSKMGIDIDGDFEPTYQISPDKKKVVSGLKAELKKADTLWIATDEDREGEAIGWHLLSALKVPKKVDVKRIVFHEITKGAIEEAVAHPRDINEDVVGAQQARRVLDRLVGYELSPVLWKKIRYGLSAGRVQSVAVRLIVDREREIEAFNPEEYWSIVANFDKEGEKFVAELSKIGGKKAKMGSEKEVKDILGDLEGADYKVASVEKKQHKKNPAPPFITSTLQQEAARKLGFSVKKTMMVAQQLYEGIDVGSGHIGLITYMRTDSVNLSKTALSAAKKVITEEFGKQYALDTPRFYKGKKGAQEAHEAIRPVNLDLTPQNANAYLKKDQARLYELIWKRTLACQMAQALLDKTGVDIEPLGGGTGGKGYMFRATGQVVKFDGFMRVYTEGRDASEGQEASEHTKDGDKLLPAMEEKDQLALDSNEAEGGILTNQHFTKPPARYTEASLVKKLEAEGIGRPSTYAPTIHTVINRGYVEKDGRSLKPTDVGMVVTDLLVEHFPNIVDYQFTADMEDKLDLVEEGKMKWIPMIKEFYGPFHKNVEEKEKTLKKADIVNEESEEVCDKCGKPMVIKLGRFGKFLSCSDYPECKNAKPLHEGADGEPEVDEAKEKAIEGLREKYKNEVCDKCGKPLEVKIGRFGPFLGCSAYPDCKNIKSIEVKTGVKCPNCGEGDLIERRTKKGGRVFWGCNRFPKCKTASWNKPVRVEGGELIVLNKDGKEVKASEIPTRGKSKK